MNKRGFTLVELLALMGLLAIIALLATPNLINQIDSQKKKNYDNFLGDLCLSAEAYLNHGKDIEGIDDFKNPGDSIDIKMEDLLANSYVKKNTKNPKTKEAVKTTDIVTVTITGDRTYECSLNGVGATKKYKEEILHGTDPILTDDMVPVTISNDGKVKKADTSKQWYKYESKLWANAVVLINSKDYEAGATIPESNIKAYYVWIPRYNYTLFNSTTPIEIQIEFENKKTTKKTTTTVGEKYTHPAFTYGTQEINGFWVGKFETSVVTTDACYTSANITNCNKELTNPRIKPNVSSLRYQQVANGYRTSLKVSSNSRMMKNDEWGAVAYLSHSKYGTCTNNTCVEVRKNNNSNFKTGCGADTNNKEASSSCEIEYGKTTSYPQSTTGNITGIFDMSGGSYEYVMGLFVDSEGKPYSGRNNTNNSGFTGKFGDGGELTTGIDFPNSNNYNLYDNPSDRNNITDDNGCNGLKCYGHALTETRNWYGDFYYFVTKGDPWMICGGSYGSSGTNSGLFLKSAGPGIAENTGSFRTVTIP